MVDLLWETLPTVEHPPQAITVAVLPPEVILFEILPRLPAKKLGRLMCIYKEWKSFISTSKFVNMHLRHVANDKSPAHHKLLKFEDYTFHALDCETHVLGLSTRRPFPFDVYPHGILILGTLHGLVCVALRNTLDQFVIWNPLTCAYKKAYNPNCFNAYINIVGFYTDSSGDYKLLHIVSKGSSSTKGAYIYSLRSDSWRKIQYLENPNRISKYVWSQATFDGQNMYFMVTRKSNRGHNFIIAFDIKLEKFRKIGFPHVYPHDSCVCGSLVALKGQIHLRVVHSVINDMLNTQSLKIELWRMVGGDDIWMKVVTFSNTWLCNPWRRRFVIVPPDDENDEHATDLKDSYKFSWYEEHYRTYWHELSKVTYVETLVSPNHVVDACM